MTTTATAASTNSYPNVAPAIEDTFRRIRNILDVYPASVWTPEDAQEVLKALSQVVRNQQKTAGAAR